MQIITCGVLSLLLVGCSTARPDTDSIGPKPANYREIVKAYIRSTFSDPSSVRDAQIAPPFPSGTMIKPDGKGWVICMKANSKNQIGSYSGLNETALIIRDGRIVDHLNKGAARQCAMAVYEPLLA